MKKGNASLIQSIEAKNSRIITTINSGNRIINGNLSALLSHNSRMFQTLINIQSEMLLLLNEIKVNISTSRNSGSSYTLNSANKNIRNDNNSSGSYSKGNVANALTKRNKGKKPQNEKSKETDFLKFKKLLQPKGLDKKKINNTFFRSQSYDKRKFGKNDQ